MTDILSDYEKAMSVIDGLSGEYTLYLNLPDPSEKLRDNPLFSIRLANNDTWEEKTGFNKLQTITL